MANAGEWYIHKHVLHGRGKHKHSFWSFHWHDHHRAVRRSGHVDLAYKANPFRWNAQGKEVLALSAMAISVLPLAPVAPFLVGTLVYSTFNYYRKHKRSHLDPDWARTHLPWHYDHHMGPNQHANWCVTRPWFDIWKGTREPYVGTAREAKDQARRAVRLQRQIEKQEAAPAAVRPQEPGLSSELS